MGTKGEIGAQIIIDDLGLPISVDEYFQKINQQYDLLFPTSKLLPDTVEIYQLCHNKVLHPFGYSLSFDEVMSFMGSSNTEVATQLCSKFSLPFNDEDYMKKISPYYPELFPYSKLMKGAEKLVRHLHAHKIPIAIASGGAQSNFDLKTTNHKEFISLFSHMVLASSDPEVKAGKPNPDVFLVCAKRFPDKPDPSKCLVFEDAPNGVAAARTAGMPVVMVPDSRLDKELTKEATLVLNSLEEFKPELFSLPPYSS
ncbi:Pseudouridine-5'-phosphatase [Armadillidium vulgare]|nr:Pseudouridine-5'-phosphatase [Armadillidium vulgare]